jgi:hypothetical protein
MLCVLTNDEHHTLDRLLTSISICVHDAGGACTATVRRAGLLLGIDEIPATINLVRSKEERFQPNASRVLCQAVL